MLRGISKSRTVGLLSELAFASISNGDLRFLTIRRTLPIPENDFVLRVLKNALNIRQFDFRHVDSTLTETGRVDSIESCRIDKLFRAPSKHRCAIQVSRKWTSGMSNRHNGKRVVSFRSNRVETTTFSTHSV